MQTLLQDYTIILKDGSSLLMNPYTPHPCDAEECHDGSVSTQPQYELIGLTLEETNAQVLEQDLKFIREERNKLIAETDWIHLPDVTVSEEYKIAMNTYRQQLRDITENYQLGDLVIWPDKPA